MSLMDKMRHHAQATAYDTPHDGQPSDRALGEAASLIMSLRPGDITVDEALACATKINTVMCRRSA